MTVTVDHVASVLDGVVACVEVNGATVDAAVADGEVDVEVMDGFLVRLVD